MQKRFGPYEIGSPLGAGGMGEVYRAKDTRLHREVAFKILSGDRVADPEHQRRFVQEARSASALNHPNILSVYDVGSENGAQYIVSELIDGEPLRKLIQKGPVPIKKFLDIATQIADGLSAAHHSGIIHRDLKPENIMITREGRVKILDFGLAKPLIPHSGGPEDETASAVKTESGIIVGTVRYMSPEQTGGEKIDFRSDQFSFGLILYEMATGQQAFQRNTPVQTLAAIATEEPPPIEKLNPKVPAPIRWLIQRCLQKDASQRFVSTADLHRQLIDLRDHLTETTSVDAMMVAPAAKRFVKRGFAVVVLIGSIIVGVLLSQFFLQPELADISSYKFFPFADEAIYEMLPVWSFDGKSIAYVGFVDGTYQIFAKAIDSPVATQLTKSKSGGSWPFWEPDSTQIFYESDGGIWSVATAGGEPQQILKDAYRATVSPDGKTFAFLRVQGDSASLWTISEKHSTPIQYREAPYGAKRFEDAIVRFSSDGSKIGIWGIIDKSGRSEFWILPYPSGKPSMVLSELSRVVLLSPFSWMPDNRRVILSFDGQLHIGDTRMNTIRQITNSTQSATSPAVSPDGKKIAFTIFQENADLVEIPLDGSPFRKLLATSRSEYRPVWSPIGNQYAYIKSEHGAKGIWLRSLAEGWEHPVVTAHDFGNEITELFEAPQFSPDGQRISYLRNAAKNYGIWISTISGGTPTRLVQGLYHSWSPDGNWIAFTDGNYGQLSLYKIRVGSGNERIKLISGEGLYGETFWSPKGDWITYLTNKGLYLVSPDGKKTILITKEIPVVHGWSRDGSTIFEIKSNEKRRRVLVSIDVASAKEKLISDLGADTPTEVFQGFSLAPNDKSFASTFGHEEADIWLLEGFNKNVGFFQKLRNLLSVQQ